MLEFIEEFKKRLAARSAEEVFTSGYCYHFAIILQTLFGGTLVYYPIANHFAVLIDGEVFDITGKVSTDEQYYDWEEYKKMDPLESNRIIMQCCYKKYEEDK